MFGYLTLKLFIFRIAWCLGSLSDKMEKEQRLEELAMRLQSVINTAIDGVITIDRKGVVESINPAGARMFGYHPDEVIGQKINMLMPPEYSEHHDEYMQRYQRTGEAHIIGIGREVKGMRKDGTVFPFRLAVSEVKMKDRTIYTGIVHDISDIQEARDRIMALNRELEKKVEERTNELEVVVNRLLKTNSILQKQEEDLQHALARERELNDLKSRFVSTASHEFRTPLSTILSSANLIEKYDEKEQQEKRKRHIDRIKSAVSNLTGILDDFLSLSKIEEGRLHVVKEQIHIKKLLDEVIEEVRPLKKQAQKLVVEGPKNDGLLIYSDPRLLKNIFLNLLSNAIKYSDEGIITCSVEIAKDSLTIQVEDEGIGIPAEEQKFLFDRFFRASNATDSQGTGLGLNIVKQYTKLLDGEITFESEEDKGTTFRVQIPNIRT